MDVLRFVAIGSVDDGKSTLIGRLLLETHSVPVDQFAAVERASRARGDPYVDLALLTDGLRAERAQSITIDVAYRYLRTHKRSFIIADCPGHAQYTRNMVTGASNADLALLLVDARNGMTQQTKRHAVIVALLGARHLLVCVNKMDLVGYDSKVYERICDEVSAFCSKLQIADVVFVPISALHGDNVTVRSPRMPWYEGTTVLYQLEHVHVASDRDFIDVRFPVQTIIRPLGEANDQSRAYVGQVVGGVMRSGDRVVVLPAGVETSIEAIETFDATIAEAYPPMVVSVRLADDVDASRGSMLARPNNRPVVSSELEAMICVTADETLGPDRTYLMMHTTNEVRARVEVVRYRLDVDSLHRETGAEGLSINEIGRVRLRTSRPILVDPYRRNRVTGSFILVDQHDYRTVAGGMVLDS